MSPMNLVPEGHIPTDPRSILVEILRFCIKYLHMDFLKGILAYIPMPL